MAPTGGTATKKRGRGRPRKEGASDAKRKRVRSPMGNGGSATATASYAAAQAQGMVAVSALNACLEHDSLAGAKALADKKALGMLKAAQEALLQKGFLVLHVDAPPR